MTKLKPIPIPDSEIAAATADLVQQWRDGNPRVRDLLPSLSEQHFRIDIDRCVQSEYANAKAWQNKLYRVLVKRGENGKQRLLIKRLDGGTDIPKRDLMAIKNQVCGPEAEAAMIFPAVSRAGDARDFWLFEQ